MGFFRFRRSVSLGKFLRLNISKTGPSGSVGRPGATINIRKDKVDATVGLPGTGLSYRERLSKGGCASVLVLSFFLTACAFFMSDDDLTFQDDVNLLQRKADAQVLRNAETGACLVATAAYQGRVMTSAFTADLPGNGWINRPLINSQKLQPHINAWGGEERLWLGPEGGQFAWFFQPGAAFDLAHWQTPPLLDTEPFAVVEKSATYVVFRKDAALRNYSGAEFHLRLERKITLITDDAELNAALHSVVPVYLKTVAYRTDNTLMNRGDAAWAADTGLPSIWLLGMMKPSPATRVVIPFKRGSVEELGPIVNDEYFGPVPSQRLKVGDGVIVFKGDGKLRGKIGLSARRATQVLGSWDPARELLTIIRFNKYAAPAGYVNSQWQQQVAPFAGDVINAYNDGPATKGAKPLGPFYELESSSPALPLAPGQSFTYRQTTVHLTGARKSLDVVARNTLGAGLDEIEAALP